MSFAGYFTMLAAPQDSPASNDNVTGESWKGRYGCGINPDFISRGLRKTTKTLSQFCWCPGLVLIQVHPPPPITAILELYR
jgi:hypothetical protein